MSQDRVSSARSTPDRADGAWLGYERLVPSALQPPEDPTNLGPRTVRDWAVDLAAIAGAATLGAVGLVTALDVSPVPVSSTTVVIDIAAGVVALGLLFQRRRWPMAVAVLTALLAIPSVLASIAAGVGLFTVAVHRRASLIVPILALSFVSTNLSILIRPSEMSAITNNLISLALNAIVVGFGMFVRARRQLVWTLLERTQRAEAERELLDVQARAAERARIAREMHDVLGHRISLLALHAGGLELRPDLPPPEVAEVAGLLRSTARAALEDLRTVIGVLRDDGSVDLPSAPQPTLADVSRMVDDSRRAGATVTLTVRVGDVATVPPLAGRVAYRVVQEALTNVAKHAHGAATLVDIVGDPDAGLTVHVRNALIAAGPGSSMPGAGVGLIGLRERVELTGGSLRHGPNDRGEFEVEAQLSWA